MSGFVLSSNGDQTDEAANTTLLPATRRTVEADATIA
jgi:hypothetical protein